MSFSSPRLYAVAKTFTLLLAVCFFVFFSRFIFVVDIDDITNQRMPSVNPHPVCPAWPLLHTYANST